MSITRQKINPITGVGAANNDARLFRALVEDLRLPLLQIARSSELAQLETNPHKNFDSAKHIEATADAALKLIDSYVFSTQVLLGQETLELEPVSPKATLYDTAQYMNEIAKLYNYKIEIDASNRCGLVMAHPKGLQAALIGLAYALIGGMAGDRSGRIVLTAHKTKRGVLAGVMTNGKTISQRALNSARGFYGDVRQPLADSLHTSSAGIYVADNLFAAMASELKAKSSHGTSGLVATLLPSQQLALL